MSKIQPSPPTSTTTTTTTTTTISDNKQECSSVDRANIKLYRKNAGFNALLEHLHGHSADRRAQVVYAILTGHYTTSADICKMVALIKRRPRKQLFDCQTMDHRCQRAQLFISTLSYVGSGSDFLRKLTRLINDIK